MNDAGRVCMLVSAHDAVPPRSINKGGYAPLDTFGCLRVPCICSLE
jgi:hypothetical protein